MSQLPEPPKPTRAMPPQDSSVDANASADRVPANTAVPLRTQDTLFDAIISENAATPPGKRDKSRTGKSQTNNGHSSKKPASSGHRQRLRERLDVGGSDALPDYELLEMVLFRAVSRADTKPIAKRLLAEFDSFAEVINAEPVRLKKIEGVGDRAVSELKLIRTAAQRLLKSVIAKRPILGSWQAVLDHCRAMQAFDNKEAFRILFLDKRNQLLADEVQGVGTVDHTPVYIREVIKRALELSSTSIILVHNHPSGDPSPSRADIDMTKMIVAAGKPLGVNVHDHIIVGRQGHASLKALGLM
jgi:DNA repair protein RadC